MHKTFQDTNIKCNSRNVLVQSKTRKHETQRTSEFFHVYQTSRWKTTFKRKIKFHAFSSDETL